MKALLINGSPRKNGNTDMMLDALREKLASGGIEIERIQLGGMAVRGCSACAMCGKNLDRRCAMDDDIMNVIIEKMLDSDAVIIGSPTFFGNVTTEVKALIDRAGLVGMVNGGMFRLKIGAAVVAVRRAGGVEAFNSINNLFHLSQMIIPGSGYWTVGYGLRPGEVARDIEAMKTISNLAASIIWLFEKLE
jgi:multimeric flavodoxin WrbA